MSDSLSALPSSRLDRSSLPSHSPHPRSPLASSADFRRRSSSRRTDASSSSYSRPILTSRPVSLWTHEPPNFSSHELVLNPDLIAAVGGISESSELFEVRLPETNSNANPLGSTLGDEIRDTDGFAPLNGSKERKKSVRSRKQKGLLRKSFLFKASQAVGDLACIERAGSQLQLSISRSIASTFGLYNRCEVILSKVPRAEHTISHVELYFRDQYVGRSDMWRLSILLEDTCVYVGQKVTLANCVKATVGRIFINEKKVMSGYVGPQTRFIFRSESAKFNIFIQMATEMWDFDEDGELYYEKALSGFLPEIDRRWKNVPANHVVSVILFARVHYDVSELHMLQEYELPLRQEEGGKKRWYIDYYKVLVDLESDCNWPNVLTLLKEEFFRFSHDVLLLRRPVAGPAGAPWLEEQHADLLRRDRALLAGTMSSSHEGNILEAVNLSLNPFDEHYIDRDLNRTGLNILVITAGTGHFDVNKQLLRLTTERLIDNGIGLDLVCLTKMPLHSVPLFHFQSQVPMPETFTSGTNASLSGTQLKTATSRPRRNTQQSNTRPIVDHQNPPPDPLYFDPKHSPLGGLSNLHNSLQYKASDLVDFYGIPHWVDCSFYNLQQDKPFRADRFIPRCKMHEVQMLGLMENEISDISIPYLDFARIPGVIARGGAGAGQQSLLNSFSSGSNAIVYGSGNTKQSRSYVLASETFGDLSGLTAREKRRLMREQFDRETFRNLESIPSTLRSWMIRGTGGDQNLTGLSSSPNPIRESSYVSTGSRQTSSRERQSKVNNQSQQQQSSSKKSQYPSLSKSPSKSMRGARTVLVTSPTLESHDEHPSDPEAQHGDQDSNRASLEKHRMSLMSSVESLTSLHSPKTNGSSDSLSTASSLSKLNLSNKGLRPLKSMGKARALVAPSQVDFTSLLVEDSFSSSKGNTMASPAQGKVSNILLGEKAEGKSSEKGKKSYSSWLWGPFRGAGKNVRGITVETDRPENDSDTSISISEASKKIQLLLKSSTTQRSPSLTSTTNTATPTKEKRGEDSEMFVQDEIIPSPILIPSQSASVGTIHGRSKESIGSQYHSEQDLLDQQALEQEEAKARYAQHAQVEKQTLVNPSNPQKSLKGTNSSQLIRWQHLFPRRLNQHVVKWRSMTTPACLPLTTVYLPTESDLEKQWQEYPYQISISSDTSSFLVKRASSTHPALAVLREMTSQRLAQGFQFIVPAGKVTADDTTTTTTTTSGSKGKTLRLREPWELFQPGNLASGNPVFLSMTNQIHRISYDRSTNSINVKRFVRKTEYDTNPLEYACCIWSRNLPGYQTVKSSFHYPDSGSYNWTYLDALIAGYSDDEEFGDATKYWRTRFVVVPSEGSPPVMKGSNGEDLSDEEVRLLGMDRLADLFGRARWRPKNLNSSNRGQSRSSHHSLQVLTTPLRFIPTSLDPAMSLGDDEFMKRVEAAYQDDSIEAGLRKQRRDKGVKQVKDLDFVALVRDMYSSTNGLKINDRLWNRIMYRESFSGADFVTWLCREYDDVKTREEATEWGNRFLHEKVLHHVHDYHGFLDGHYFYQLTPQYFASRPAHPEKGWFNSVAKLNTKAGLSTKDQLETGETNKVPRKGSRRVLMSRSMIIDVDSNRKSDRAEVALLHYDIAHNPTNGFNFQIHWLGTTARFIEDTVQSWTRSVERYGLRCIEAPINQIKDVSRHNPFQSPLPIILALHPPTSIMFANLLAAHTDSHHFFQYSLLRKFGFILDQEASEKYANISIEIEIEYKSRPNVFDLSQFVHRSGVAFVQVLKGNEGFLWLDNRLFNSHLHQQQQQQSHQQTSSSNQHSDGYNHNSSSSTSHSNNNNNNHHHHHHHLHHHNNNQPWIPSADSVRREFIDFCSDASRLEAFYREALEGLKRASEEGEKQHSVSIQRN